ncbi:MAG: efflux transporter outer membrane subunit [Serpentinimonas sp.]|nr:efflux transporter outer membrane subunit [Serpentinimonas sp.]
MTLPERPDVHHAGQYRPSPRRLSAACLALALAACATPPAPLQSAGDLPSRWYAPVPVMDSEVQAHGGKEEGLGQWWAQFNDSALTQLIVTAQARNGSVLEAAARIAQARAESVSTGASAQPQLQGGVALQRGRGSTGSLASTGSVSVDASWELDLWGGLKAGRSAALAQLEASEASWHDARVSVAAETAQNYVRFRSCQRLADTLQDDARSLATSAALTERKVSAGLESPANAALVRASAASSAANLVAQQAVCESLVKSLVALTGLTEPELRVLLSQGVQEVPAPRNFEVEQVPARWLAQRPDLRSAERQAAAARQEIDVAEANRWPQLSLLGSVGRTRASGGNGSAMIFEGTSWSIGPSLSIPLLDGQRRSAAADAARGRYEEARSRYIQRVRDAVAEVENALTDLDAASRRQSDAEKAVAGFDAFLNAQRRLTEAGAGSLLDLEDARRTALSARSNLIDVQTDRVLAWIALYRAVGGGWSAESPPESTALSQAPPQD